MNLKRHDIAELKDSFLMTYEMGKIRNVEKVANALSNILSEALTILDQMAEALENIKERENERISKMREKLGDSAVIEASVFLIAKEALKTYNEQWRK